MIKVNKQEDSKFLFEIVILKYSIIQKSPLDGKIGETYFCT